MELVVYQILMFCCFIIFAFASIIALMLNLYLIASLSLLSCIITGLSIHLYYKGANYV